MAYVPIRVMMALSVAAVFVASDAEAQYDLLTAPQSMNRGAADSLTMGGFYAGGAGRYATYRPPPISLYPRYRYAHGDRALATLLLRPTWQRYNDPRRGLGTPKPFERARPAPMVYERYPSLRRVPVLDRGTGEERAIWWIY